MSGPHPLPPPLPRREQPPSTQPHSPAPIQPVLQRRRFATRNVGWLLFGVGFLAAAVIGLALSRGGDPNPDIAITTGPEPAPTDPPSPDTSPTTQPPYERAPGEPGTRESPVPLGRYGAVGDGWNMRVNWVDVDADEAVLAASRLNDPPEAGRSYVVANITVVYKGTAPETADNVTTGYLGLVTGEDVSDFTDPAGLVIAPTPDLYLYNDVVPGAQLTGNIVYSVADADLGQLLVIGAPFGEYMIGHHTYFATTA